MSEVADALNTGVPAPSTPSPAPAPAPGETSTPAPTPTPSPSPTPEPSGDRWQDKFLSAELKGDETLARYGSIDEMGKALIETQRFARGRVAIPAADNPDAFAEFASKIRPEKAEDYKIGDAEGNQTEMGEAMRPVFHEVGLHPLQAEKLSSAWNQYQADVVSKQAQQGRDEMNAVEFEFGPAAYNQRLAATENMLKEAGIDIGDLTTGLEQTVGAGKTLRALFALAEKTGELSKVGDAQTQLRMGSMTPQQASDEIDRMDASPEIRAKVADKSSPEYARRSQLMQLMQKRG
ncbi:hypothetical protein [Stakelama pacifica]|uniref:Capsid assembly protein n=1 Tax=Stakelama pacifica TaxID=517720 RepID=A0A4V3BTD9_9SPHN|nr:hypothetical protein [Stakelama pacifica]TDN82978.1 hypothetical protein EV664_105176 [Stakelama pacifica]GGO95021.1 hypothetical protein GCM10011329_18220 [Stakelama pacifica]